MTEELSEIEKKAEEWRLDNNVSRPHKIPVPTQYRQAAKILKQIVEEGKSFKELVYNNKHIVSSNSFLSPRLLNFIFSPENWQHCRVVEQNTGK